MINYDQLQCTLSLELIYFTQLIFIMNIFNLELFIPKLKNMVWFILTSDCFSYEQLSCSLIRD